MRPLLLAAILTPFCFATEESVPLIRYGAPELVGHLEDGRITESSGLAASGRDAGLLWTINDSGNPPLLFALGLHGEKRGVFRLPAVENLDWEDLSSFKLDGEPYLLVADVGDNERKKKSVALHILPEPEVVDAPGEEIRDTRSVRTLRFTYEDGPHDCEAVAVDGEGRKVYLVVKELLGNAGVYELDLPPGEGRTPPVKAKRLLSIPVPLATGLAISPDNRRLVVSTYTDAWEFYRTPQETWPDALARLPRRLPMPARKQGEAICYGPSGNALYLTSEKTPAPLWKVAGVRP